MILEKLDISNLLSLTTSKYRRYLMKNRIIGALIGAIPGLILLIISGPVQGEIELTLAMGGIFLTVVGIVIGIVFSGRFSKK